MPAFDLSTYYVIFFVVFLVVCFFIYMNIILAVIYNNYRKHLKVGVVHMFQCQMQWYICLTPSDNFTRKLIFRIST